MTLLMYDKKYQTYVYEDIDIICESGLIDNDVWFACVWELTCKYWGNLWDSHYLYLYSYEKIIFIITDLKFHIHPIFPGDIHMKNSYNQYVPLDFLVCVSNTGK